MRGEQQAALEVFVGDWQAEGLSFGGPNQDPADPRADPTRWISTHSARWHSGEFFLIQNEHAQVRGPFDTFSVMGWDDDAGRHFASFYDNHGFRRHYDVLAEGSVWWFNGERERARIEFSDDGRRQTIAWQWRPDDDWLPLCDRVADKR